MRSGGDANFSARSGFVPSEASVAGDEKQRVVLDNALLAVGFELTHIAADAVAGRLVVTEACCSQAWQGSTAKVMGGGVAALVAEALAGLGGYVAAGCRRVAGVHMSISHVTPASLGDHVEARARPVGDSGHNVQVITTCVGWL